MHTRPILQDRHASRRLTSLDVSDVDLDKGEVTLKLKKKRSNRVLFLDNEAIAVFKGAGSAKEPEGRRGPGAFCIKERYKDHQEKAQRRLSRNMQNVLAFIMNNQTILKIDLLHIAVDIVRYTFSQLWKCPGISLRSCEGTRAARL